MSASLLKNKKTRYYTIFGIIFMNMGALFLLLLLYYDYHEFHKINSYKQTLGGVKEVKLVAICNGVEQTPDDVADLDDQNTVFRVDVQYWYSVDSLWFENDKVFAGEFASNYFDNLVDAEERVENYKRKSFVSVYYNPDNFSDAVLDPRMEVNRQLLIISFLLIVAGITCTLILIIIRPDK